MTDAELIARLLDTFPGSLMPEAADRIEALIAERDALKHDIERHDKVELVGEIAWLQLGTGKNLATGTQIMDMQKMRERAERAEAERDALRQLVVEVLDDLAEAKWSMGTDWVSRAQAASGSSHN